MAFHHGITAQETSNGILPMRNSRMSTLCLIAISDDADDTMYPKNTPVLLTGITQNNIEKAGKTGTLYHSLKHIRDIHNPTIIVLRITKDDVDAIDNLYKCQSLLGISPDIMGAPEIDTPNLVNKMVSYAEKRRCLVYASPRNDKGELLTKKEDIVNYRKKSGSRNLHLIENQWIGSETKAAKKNFYLDITIFKNDSIPKGVDDVAYKVVNGSGELLREVPPTKTTEETKVSKVVLGTLLSAFFTQKSGLLPLIGPQSEDGIIYPMMFMSGFSDAKIYRAPTSLEEATQAVKKALKANEKTISDADLKKLLVSTPSTISLLPSGNEKNIFNYLGKYYPSNRIDINSDFSIDIAELLKTLS